MSRIISNPNPSSTLSLIMNHPELLPYVLFSTHYHASSSPFNSFFYHTERMIMKQELVEKVEESNPAKVGTLSRKAGTDSPSLTRSSRKGATASAGSSPQAGRKKKTKEEDNNNSSEE